MVSEIIRGEFAAFWLDSTRCLVYDLTRYKMFYYLNLYKGLKLEERSFMVAKIATLTYIRD